MKKSFPFIILFALCAQIAVANAQTIIAPPLQGIVVPSLCEKTSMIAIDPPPNIDMKKVRDTWLGWYNDARVQNGLPPFVYDELLNQTAGNWSFYSKKRGYIDHKRAGQKSYYDYKKVGAWFASKGVSFTRGSGRSDFVENIGWDYYSCPAPASESASASTADCTDKLIASIKHTYNFFMSEKGKKYRAHYDSIMNKNYKKIGLGISVDPAKKKYYLTVHYGTDVVAVNDTAKNIAACGLPGNGKF